MSSPSSGSSTVDSAERTAATTGSAFSEKLIAIVYNILDGCATSLPAARAWNRLPLLRRLGGSAAARLEPAGRAGEPDLAARSADVVLLPRHRHLARARGRPAPPLGLPRPARDDRRRRPALRRVAAGDRRAGTAACRLRSCGPVRRDPACARERADRDAPARCAAVGGRRCALAARRSARPGRALVGRLPRTDDRRRAARARGDEPSHTRRPDPLPRPYAALPRRACPLGGRRRRRHPPRRRSPCRLCALAFPLRCRPPHRTADRAAALCRARASCRLRLGWALRRPLGSLRRRRRRLRTRRRAARALRRLRLLDDLRTRTGDLPRRPRPPHPVPPTLLPSPRAPACRPCAAGRRRPRLEF